MAFADNPDFNFAATGDFGCGDEAKRTVNNIKAKDPELVILTRRPLLPKICPDLLVQYSGFPLDVNGKLKIAFGEHDIDGNLTKYNNYLQHFNLTKPYYSFDYQNVHFLVMATAKNSVVPYLSGSEQYDFVKDGLKKAHKNAEINWIIVDTFRPLYSSNTTHPVLHKFQDIYTSIV